MLAANRMTFLHSFGFLYQKLRLKNPWNYKAPLLMALPYFMISASAIPASTALLGIAASLCTILGIAGFAYFLNDLTDLEQDLAVGRDNILGGLSQVQKVLLAALLVSAALLPWTYLPLTWTNGSLLGGEFLLFFLYSVPPFRLKERGLAGVCTDALYAHAVPAVLAALTFALLGSQPYAHLGPFLLSLGLWQGVLGVRNIVLHQLKDHDEDIRAGTQTLATQLGPERLQRYLKYGLVPLEIVAFGLFAVWFSWQIPALIPTYCVYLGLTVLKIRWVWKSALPATVREVLYKYFDDFYLEWIPLIVLVSLVLENPVFVLLLLVHVALFRSALWQWGHEVKQYLGRAGL